MQVFKYFKEFRKRLGEVRFISYLCDINQNNTIMKNYQHVLLRVVAAVALLWVNFSLTARENEDPRTHISKNLTKFSHVKIVDVTKVQTFYTWGYPGIWIRETKDDNARISYDNVCTPYISAEVVADTLVVELDQSFLYPSKTTWHPSYGMISAITIDVPASYNLASVYNNGTYQYNTSLINFKSDAMTIISSNSFRILNCKFKNLYWNQVEGQPLAQRCQYSLLLKLSEIGKLMINENGLPEFTMGDNLASIIEKIECVK